MADGHEFEGRFVEAFDRNTRAHERNAQAFERNTRAWRHVVAAMRSISERLDSQRGEMRARTEAIWRMIDRLDAGGQGA